MRPVFVLALLAGCGERFRVDDSFASSIDLPLFGDYGDNRINSPYLRGAGFQFLVVGDADEIADLTLASDDDAVLTIGPTATDPDDDGRRLADAQAVAPGTALLTVTDGRGRERQSFAVRVGDPDRLDLHPVVRLVQDDETADEAPTLVVGGRAELEVHPYDGSSLLVGSAGQFPTSPAGLLVEAGSYHASGLHDVLALTPSEPGTWTLAMPYTGGSVDLTVDAVAVEAVTALQAECMATDDMNDGDTLYCLSTATLADATDVYGVAPAWDVGGSALTGTGDLLLVTYASGDERGATATYGPLTATATVSGAPQSVGSTNDVVACASVAGASPWAVLMALGLALVRRRRPAVE